LVSGLASIILASSDFWVDVGGIDVGAMFYYYPAVVFEGGEVSISVQFDAMGISRYSHRPSVRNIAAAEE
jgi:hypothetical protein